MSIQDSRKVGKYEHEAQTSGSVACRSTRLRFVLVLVLPLACTSLAVGDDSLDSRYLDGLRQRQMFPLAETFCRDQLRRADLSPRQRSDTVIELSRTLAQHAVHLPPAKRGPLWRQSLEVTTQFAQNQAQNPRLVLVRTQGALSLLVRGELMREETQLVGGGPKRLEAAKSYLREAIKRLESIGESVAVELARRNRPVRLGDDDLATYEMLALENNLNFQLARALRNQGLSYPADSPDRANSLQQALERLGPVARTISDSNIVWRARLEEIVCLRFLSRTNQATRKLAELIKQEPPIWVKRQGRAEWIRLALGMSKLPEALTAAAPTKETSGRGLADLHLAQLEAKLAALENAKRKKDKVGVAQWHNEAKEQVQLIERLHGAYWTRLAETHLASSVSQDDSTASVRALAAAAYGFLQGGQLPAAVSAYDRASKKAAAEGDTENAFLHGGHAAAIESERKAYDRSAARFRQIALDAPRHARSPDAHLRGVLDEAAAVHGGLHRSTDIYREMLEEHVRLWPKSPTIGEVRWRLGWIHASARKWRSAIEQFVAVPAGHERHARAIGDAEKTYGSWLAELKVAGKPTEQLAIAAARSFEAAIIDSAGQAPREWNDAHRIAATAAASLWLYETKSGYRQAETLLTAALTGSPDADAAWQTSTQLLLVLSQAGQGKQQLAQQTLQQLSGGSPEELLNLLGGLARTGQDADGPVRRNLAILQLGAVKLLATHREKLSAPHQRTLDRLHATALADSGNRTAAIKAFLALATRYANDGAIQEAYAEQLIDTDGARNTTATERIAQLREGLAKWRAIERRSRKATPRWYRARYAQAVALERLGRKPEAAQIVKLTRVLHEDLGGEAMRARFLALLKRCGS